jgi:cytochrome c556
MYRSLLAVASIVAVTTAVFAQADLVAARKALMGENGKYMYRAFPNMMKGEQPYDQATVDAGFTQLAATAAKLPALYAASTKDLAPSGRYNASPKVWESKADFDKKIADFAASVASAKGKATGVDGLKQAYSEVSRACDSCHDQYRVRN